MDISLIVAVSENGVIGRDNDLPWKLSSDLKRFKRLTMGKPIIMGRRTFDSIGRPLPGRSNIIVSRDEGFGAEGISVVHSIAQASELGELEAIKAGVTEYMVIGGAEIYRLFLPFATKLYYTLVKMTIEGDAFFPPVDPRIWQEAHSEDVAEGEADSAAHRFIIYEKI